MKTTKRILRALVTVGLAAIGLAVIYWLLKKIIGLVWSSLAGFFASPQLVSISGFSLPVDLNKVNAALILLSLFSLFVSIFARRTFVLVTGITPKVPEFMSHYRCWLELAARKLLAFTPALIGLALLFSLLNWVYVQIEPRLHLAFDYVAFFGFWAGILLGTWVLGSILEVRVIDKHLPQASTGVVSQTLTALAILVGAVVLWSVGHPVAAVILLVFGALGAIAFAGVLVRVAIFAVTYPFKAGWVTLLGRRTWRWVTA